MVARRPAPRTPRHAFGRRLAVLASAGALLVAPALSACAPTYADGYQDAFAAGLRAQHAGRWDEAASAFDRAASLGERYKDRDEARLMNAKMLERLERWDDAEAAYRKTEVEAGGRYQGVRAAFALGRLVWQQKGFEEGEKELLRAVRTYPASGLVRHAIKRLLMEVEETRGPEAALAWLAPIEKELHDTEAGEAASYEYATLLARADKKEEAITALLALARAHPYPNGSLTDDAFYVASLFLEDVGKYREAVDVLEEMLAPKEQPYGGSSLERPRFPQAAYRIAILYRDRFHDEARARRELWRMVEEHFDSRLTDDALWQLARLERQSGNEEAACKALDTLKEKKPDSRFNRCAHELCARIPEAERKCTGSVLESLGKDPDEVWARDAPAPAGEP